MKQGLNNSTSLASDQKESKITVSSLRILFPNLDKTYYLNIILNNETKPFKTKQIEFKGNSNQCTIDQSFLVDPAIKSLELVSFQLFEKTSIFSSPLYKGEVKGFQQQCDDFSPNLLCYLKKSTNEDFAVIYYNIEFKGEDIYQMLKKAKPTQNNNRSSTVSMMDFSTGDKNGSYSLFIHNLDYLRNTIEMIEDIIHWKNYWKTLGLLFLISFAVLSFKLLIVFLLPMGLIFLHLMYKDKMVNSFILKGKEFDKEKNLKLFNQIISLVNSLIMLYDNFAMRLTSEDNGVFITGLYSNLVKISIWGFALFYTPLKRFIMIKPFALMALWMCLLSLNPTYYAFYIFIRGLLKEKFNSIGYSTAKPTEIRRYLKNALYKSVPFLDMISDKRAYDEIKDNSLFTSKVSSFEPILTLQKYELYENERWWMFIGWTKNMIMNEIPIWCTVEETKAYCDMKMVFLSNANEFKWDGDWKVRKTEHTDENGWEYANNSFTDLFSAKDEGKYVRRRKWVRYASLKVKE